MLPAGFASITVRKKDCRVNSGKSFSSNPWSNIGACMEIKFNFLISAQCNEVMSL